MRSLLIDLDGVLYVGDAAIPGAARNRLLKVSPSTLYRRLQATT